MAAAMVFGLMAFNGCAALTRDEGGSSDKAQATLTFSNSAITAQGGSGYEIDGTDVTISESGTYVLKGSCSDGSVLVEKGTKGVTLVLDGLELKSADTAPIVIGKSCETTIEVSEDSVNSLEDDASNNDETNADNKNAENAVIKCKDGSAVSICGGGMLKITANGKNGIKSGSTTDEEGEASLTISEANIEIDAPVNDAINAEQLLVIESGKLDISAKDDGIHSDLGLVIGAEGSDGPTINIAQSYEGLEGASIDIYSGDITIESSDDCINAANSQLKDYDFSLNIAGGTIDARSSGGDGFDSNGSLTISGGDVTVWTANGADDQPLDADGTITVSGGTVLAAGASGGMGMNVSAEQAFISLNAQDTQDSGERTALISQGSEFEIKDSSGSVHLSGSAVYDARFVFFSSAQLVKDGEYSISASQEDESKATAQSGTVKIGSGGMMNGGMPQASKMNRLAALSSQQA